VPQKPDPRLAGIVLCLAYPDLLDQSRKGLLILGYAGWARAQQLEAKLSPRSARL
jgi:hypothetical protein